MRSFYVLRGEDLLLTWCEMTEGGSWSTARPSGGDQGFKINLGDWNEHRHFSRFQNSITTTSYSFNEKGKRL